MWANNGGLSRIRSLIGRAELQVPRSIGSTGVAAAAGAHTAAAREHRNSRSHDHYVSPTLPLHFPAPNSL